MNTFRFGDPVTVVVLGRITEGVVVSGIDQDGDYKIAYNGGWNYFKPDDIKLRSPNVTPVPVPNLTMLRAGKITAIKELREVTQWSLRDAKDVVEAIADMATDPELRSKLITEQYRVFELEHKLCKLYSKLDKNKLIEMLLE